MSFKEQFDPYGMWRRESALQLKLLADWMCSHDFFGAAAVERLRRLEAQVRSEKVVVVFVSEFSRGKSELINAIFFAGYGRRIMPASTGRTTMCPTELGYDADIPPCLRLLPIETRLQTQALMDWRAAPEKWTLVDLDVNDPKQLAQALEKVAEVCHVTKDEAQALGYWHDENIDNNPLVNADGLTKVPKWRHALINIAHPLLKKGLVILDTPGLNAIGAEPELSVSLIPQAHALVFILAADTGVTKSELAIWREHLSTENDENISRLAVLNKIDVLWDALSSPQQVQAQIERQRTKSADILGLPIEQVIPVSAQKGLLAKITRDDDLLQASCLPNLELALAEGIMGKRQTILRKAVAKGIAELRVEAGRSIQVRRRDLAEQMDELRGLKGKNVSVITHMRTRIELEQTGFDTSSAKIQAVRSVYLKLLREVFVLLGTSALKTDLIELTSALKQPSIKFGAKKAYGQTFLRLQDALQNVENASGEIHAMLMASFEQLNAEFGFSLQAPKAPDLTRYKNDLNQIERGHLQYLGVTNVIKLSQPDFSERLVRALSTRLRVVYESALGEVELWKKSVGAQLDTQLHERRRTFGRRLETIERIQNATADLDERIGEIDVQETALNALDALDAKLSELTSCLAGTPFVISESVAPDILLDALEDATP